MGRRQWKPARHLQAFPVEGRKHRRQRSLVGNRDDRALLCFPDGGRRSVLGDRFRLERQLEVGRLEDDEPHGVLPLLMQDEGEIVERDQRMEVIGKDVNEIGERPVRSKRPGQAQDRVVAREVRRDENGPIRHQWPGGHGVPRPGRVSRSH